MAKTTRVLVIDPVKGEVREINWDGNLEEVYKTVGVSILDHASGPVVGRKGERGVAFVDDGGLFTNKPRWFWREFYPTPLVGIAFVFGADARGETVDVPYRADDVLPQIGWELLMGPDTQTGGNA
jgi:hypothetical protein